MIGLSNSRAPYAAYPPLALLSRRGFGGDLEHFALCRSQSVRKQQS
jgi:hypothetical protein